MEADIEIRPDESGWHIEALAPDGMEWVASGGVSLVCRIFNNVTDRKKDREEQLTDLYNRMKEGVQYESN